MTQSQPPAPTSSSTGPLVIAGLVLVLLIVHQDNWFWESKTLVFGFMPIGLFWHACISIAASATWYLATKIAWPLDDGRDVPGGETSSSAPATTGENQ